MSQETNESTNQSRTNLRSPPARLGQEKMVIQTKLRRDVDNRSGRSQFSQISSVTSSIRSKASEMKLKENLRMLEELAALKIVENEVSNEHELLVIEAEKRIAKVKLLKANQEISVKKTLMRERHQLMIQHIEDESERMCRQEWVNAERSHNYATEDNLYEDSKEEVTNESNIQKSKGSTISNRTVYKTISSNFLGYDEKRNKDFESNVTKSKQTVKHNKKSTKEEEEKLKKVLDIEASKVKTENQIPKKSTEQDQTQNQSFQAQGQNDYMTRYMARQLHCRLPKYKGDIKEWLSWFIHFQETTIECGFSDNENIIRLRECLEGAAYEKVEALLDSKDNLTEVIDTLKFWFGQSEHIIIDLIDRTQSVPHIKENDLRSLMNYSTTVNNLSAKLRSMNNTAYLFNPDLIQQLISKLPTTYRAQWGMYIMQKQDTISVKHFGDWLNVIARGISLVVPPETGSTTTNRRYSTQTERVNTHVTGYDAEICEQCLFCDQPGHQLDECNKFEVESYEERKNFVESNRVCYACLRKGHYSSDCHNQKVCGKHGCTSIKHHAYVHQDYRH